LEINKNMDKQDGLVLLLICILFLATGLCIGCGMMSHYYKTRYSISKYSGNVVVGKNDLSLTIDSCGLIREIDCTEYQLSLYNLGDTIK